MSKTVKLSDNHKRVVSVVLKYIEKSLDELTGTLNYPESGITYEVLTDVSQDRIHLVNAKIIEIKSLIEIMLSKYGLNREVLRQSSIMNAKKNNLWSVLHDTRTSKLNNYGKFSEEHARDFDAEISQLIELINKI